MGRDYRGYCKDGSVEMQPLWKMEFQDQGKGLQNIYAEMDKGTTNTYLIY